MESLCSSTATASAGKKDNEKKMKKQQRRTARDVKNYRDIESATESPLTKPGDFEVVFIRETRSMGCYGCGGKWRADLRSPIPPSPWDIILKRKERKRKMFKRRGSTRLSFGTADENVFQWV